MKKVLIITYYWPPAGGPGVQRVLKFVKYLPKFGWEPIILTVENGEYPAIDESLLYEIPTNIKVYKTKSFEPFNLYKGLTGQKGNIPTHILNKSENESIIQKFAKWIRANLFIPDARKGWIPSIVKKGLEIVEQEKPDLIFSSSPPHSLQVGAMKLAMRTNLKWVVDFRDPWTDGFWLKDLSRTKYASKKDLDFELSVLKNSNAVISVSQSIIELFKRKIENNYYVLPNGYDESDFADLTREQSDVFKIVYAGSLRDSQIPHNLFKALASLKEQRLIEKLELHFIGTVHPDAVKIITNNNLQDLVTFHKYMTHNKLLKHVINANMLLLTIPNTPNNEGILTGKLFEYVASKNYILGFGPKNGDAAKIINELNCGIMFEFSENPEQVILDKYNEWLKDSGKQIDNNAEKYTRKNLTRELSEIFDSLI